LNLARHPQWLLLGLVGAILVASFFSLSTGAVSISWSQLWSLLTNASASETNAIIVLKLRLPRLLTGLLAGSSLALAGCVMQGVFRNPLAEPYLLGVASGATSGAAVCIALGLATLPFVLPGAALLGSMMAVSLVFLLAQHTTSNQSNTTLILVGIAVGAMFSALTSFMIFFSQRDQLQQLIFWSMGDLGGLTLPQLLPLSVVLLAAALLTYRYHQELDAMTLGEEMARHLGVAITRIKYTLLGLSTVMTALIVAGTGTIGFVGLIIPHLMRLLCGPHHRLLMPASALAGAAFLVGSDTLARQIARPHELPVGLITSLFGAPFFLFLLKKHNAIQPQNHTTT
jgi:iron complex transport system permease protein